MTDNLSFSTHGFDPAECFARYRDFYSYGADAVELGGSVTADVEAWRLGGLVLFERRLTGLGAERLAPRVRRNDFDHFTLQLNLCGEFHGEGADGFRSVGPGEILLLDMTKPMRIRMPDAHLITVAVPRAVFEAAGAATDALHGLVVPARQAIGLAGFLSSSVDLAPQMPDTDLPNAADVLARLLGAALSEMGLGKVGARARADDERRRAAQRFIREHIFEEALSPDRVARATGLSRATLYRLFDDVGGVRKYIQMQRLARLRICLSDPAEQQSVAALAHDVGFASEHHASRSFRREFGLPPAKFRSEVLGSTFSRYGADASALKRKMIAWYSDLAA